MRRSTRSNWAAVASLTLLGSLTLAVSVDAQARRPQEERSKAEQIYILEIQVPVTVKLGSRFVEGLTAANFEVYEDGKQQKIAAFIAPGLFPRRMTFLTDVDPPAFEKIAAEDFVGMAAYNRGDSDLELYRDFTGKYTSLLDDIYHAIEDNPPPSQEPGARQILIVLSQSGDARSERALKDAIEMAQRHNVTVFVIRTNRSAAPMEVAGESSRDRDLKSLCEETGGHFFHTFDKPTLFRAFTQIEDTLRPEYTISYIPQSQEKTSRNRSIEIKLVKAEGQAHHKQGYVY